MGMGHGPGGRNKKAPAKPKNLGKTFRRLMSYLADTPMARFKLVIVFILVILGSAATIAGTYLLTPAINTGILPLIGKTVDAQALQPFIRIVVTMGIIYLCGAAATYTYNFIMMRTSAKILKKVRNQMFDKLETLPLRYYDTNPTGDTMSRFTNDVDTLRDCLANAIPQLFASCITVVGTFVMMLVLSWQLTMIVIVMLVIMTTIVKTLGSRSARGFAAQQKALGVVDGYIEEMISGQKVVKVFNHEPETKSEFAGLSENLRDASTKANTYANILMPIMGNLSYVQYAIAAATGGWLIINGGMTIGALASFLQYSRSFSQPITQISQLINTILTALAGAERIFTLIDEEPEIDDGVVTLANVCEDKNGKLSECEQVTNEWAWKVPNKDGSFDYKKLRGDVRFEDVTFSYDGKRTILKDISLFAKPGQKIAFVGSTGAGKTTITNLLNRFYEIDNGKILYDGVNIKDIKKADLRHSLAMVLQDTHLFTGTVRDNIRYGRLNATDEEVEGAAKLANADSFIRHLPHGYDTMITGDGANLSQGQRQLLAIARAAVANPPVLVLDEATSSIDTRTEKHIEKGMDALMNDRTVFVIAHRLSTVQNSDAILVLEHGQIIERGDHDDLMKQKGRYYQLQTGQAELS
ncbi:MAG: ABC transporter ATP-binding protein [Eubacteriaceae bacterium]|jgi:ATP-binding cassette subfamily B multidrug efflux pump